MAQAHIAELHPELPARESKHFRATVTLIWPYSSSARQLALLLAEPDLGLRRQGGRVRARFSGASAEAMATTGVGIGDEVVLSLRGAQFVNEGLVRTPGKSIEWELAYAHTLVLQLFRNGGEAASIGLLEAAPAPASPSPSPSPSPARNTPAAAPTPARQYSSPAFLKHARLSDGPSFGAPYDPLADATEDEGHDKKRRRKSYRDWKAWTYSARMPSPEKDDMTPDEQGDMAEASPGRAAQLPHTPVSHPPPDAQYAFGGDTEVDTEVNTEEEDPVQGENEGISLSTTEANEQAATTTPPLPDALSITMPPPTLSAFPAHLQGTASVGPLTPIGREPASPTLRPQDSATLPLPSPFPGEPENNTTSYFDHHVVSEQTMEGDTRDKEEQSLPSEASYIGEASFFSSIGSSKASIFHPNHESAFTPVRFTFGMDGTGFSRPMELSSPPPGAPSDNDQDAEPEYSASVEGGKDVSKLKGSRWQLLSEYGFPIEHRRPKSPSLEQDRNQDQSQATDLDSNSEFVHLDFATGISNAILVPEERIVTHTQSQEPEPSADVQMVPPLSVKHPSEPILEATDEYLQAAFPMDHISHASEAEQQVDLEQHPDVKMESIEDDARLQLDEFVVGGAYENLNTSAKPTGEDFVTTPKEDHTMDETQTVHVPPTVAAKNTRSRVKAPTSPTFDAASVPNRTTRSTRSRGSVSSAARSVISPPRTRGRSVISPSQTEAHDALSTNLQTSPGRQLDPAFLKSSEGAHFERSGSFTRPSEETASLQAMDASSPAKQKTAGKEDNKDGEDLSNTDTGLRTRSGARTERKKLSPKTVVEARISQAAVPETDSAQPAARSPSRRLRSTGPIEPAAQSPRSMRRRRKQAYNLSESQESAGTGETYAKADGKPNQDPPYSEDGAEGRQKASSQDTTVDADKTLRNSPASDAHARPRVTRNAGMQRTRPMTPEATQQTKMESQSSSTTVPAGQKSLPKPATKTTPGRPTMTRDAPCTTSLETAAPDQPSIGLSTPLSYYTPLKDLLYFLNRSSQFHSPADSSPDILALVTSATSPPEKARKGPKHWFTTLHITDPSLWSQHTAQTTSVQIFRPYATALPEAAPGDVMLLRAFTVKSLNRQPMLISHDESAWCVWRWAGWKPVWGANKGGAFGDLMAREHATGPSVERGEGERRQVTRLRRWFVERVESGLRAGDGEESSEKGEGME